MVIPDFFLSSVFTVNIFFFILKALQDTEKLIQRTWKYLNTEFQVVFSQHVVKTKKFFSKIGPKMDK